MMRVVAVILAGGTGERLGGVIKANLEIGGTRLLERVSSALGPLPAPVIVAHGATPPHAIGLLPGQIAVADLPTADGGPLAGLAAAASYCRDLPERPDALVMIAVDTPFVPADYVSRLVAALGESAPAVIARYGEQAYPTSSIWRLEAIAGLPEDLAAGRAPHSLKRLAAALGARSLDWPETAGGDPFANVNTPDDLRRLAARAARH